MASLVGRSYPICTMTVYTSGVPRSASGGRLNDRAGTGASMRKLLAFGKLPFLATSLIGFSLAGCGPAPVSAPDPTIYQSIGPLEVSAAIDQNSSEILAAVDLMNTSQETIRVVYAGFCEVAVLVFRADRRSSGPVWDSSRWWSGVDECPREMLVLEIPPITLARVIAPLLEARNISGDSLPSGRYVSAMRFRLVEPRDTTLTLPAGNLELQSTGAIDNLLARSVGQ